VSASRFVVKAWLVLAMLQTPSAFASDARSLDKVSFYFAAHEDDWQLFMNPSAFQDVINPKTKTVFIHTTAGDAGAGTGTNGRQRPYYLARENGAQAAIRFMADASTTYPLRRSVDRFTLNGHPLYRVRYRNTVTYFLRAPDGHPSGSGYATTYHQSLQRLATGQASILSAIDGSTTYRGWRDLVTTVRRLLDYERGSAPTVQINVAELDETLNPGDHSDHRMTAKAALDAAEGLSCARRLHYVDYASSRLPVNLSPEERDMESSVVAVTAAGLLALDHSSIWRQYYQSYLGKNYFRVEEGNGRCEPGRPQLAHSLTSAIRKSR
jgi:hypothetical protein